MASGYATEIYGRVVLSTDRRKHLNLLIADRSEENARTYGWRGPPTGYSLHSKSKNTVSGGP